MSIRRIAGCLAGGIAAAVSVQVAAYPLWRRRCLTWGATREEATGPLPGDDLLEKPAIVSTRAVTIETAPEAIWPWLVQMGPGARAGRHGEKVHADAGGADGLGGDAGEIAQPLLAPVAGVRANEMAGWLR